MLIHCPHCEAKNHANRRHCIGCGEHLGCTSCGFVNLDLEANSDLSICYCGGCGLPIIPDASSPMPYVSIEEPTIGKPATETIAAPDGPMVNFEEDDIKPSVMGFDYEEVLQDVKNETEGEEEVTIGGPKHLDQSQLDDLFDV